MPRRKCCEHPTRHANSAYRLKGVAAVSPQLSMFLVSRYDIADDKIRWLCPRCHAFERKQMMNHQSMEFNNDQSSSDNDEVMEEDSADDNDNNNDDELMAENFPVDGDDNNGDVDEEDEHSYQMDSGIITEQNKDDNDSPCTNGEATDSKSMDEESAMFRMNSNTRKTKRQNNCRLYSDYLT